VLLKALQLIFAALFNRYVFLWNYFIPMFDPVNSNM